jgi:N-acetylglucosaminyldiphosphoundecaprenol N-acetyl-beta-D-mannosaminyltransferase
MSMVQEDELDVDGLDAAITSSFGAMAQRENVAVESSHVSVFGVRICNLAQHDAVALLEEALCEYDGQSRAVYFVNAHTLNLASRRMGYRTLLNRAYRVFGDGTGVRWAARLRGVRMKANLNGTDLVPRLFSDTAGRGYRYFLLGATADTIARAAAAAGERFPGWTLAGFHHGFIPKRRCRDVIEQINDANPHVLLVGMGNPLQERWIDRHLDALRVPLCMGTGGLFDHWAGNLRRAPRWVRWLGCEWAQLLLQQPHKWRRYLLGNPRFLWRMIADRRRDIELIEDRPVSDPLAADPGERCLEEIALCQLQIANLTAASRAAGQ